jgi:hypothetical protein
MYYRRADDEIPHDFVQVMKESIKRIARSSFGTW